MIKMGIDADRLYSVADVAGILNVSRKTMERLVKETPLEYVNLNGGRQYSSIRILGSTLINFIEKNTVTGDRKPLYDAKSRKNTIFRSLQGRC
jgi:hypothetical protein